MAVMLDGMSKKAVSLSLSPAERATLKARAASCTEAARVVQRARIVLAAAAGRSNVEIAQEVGLVRQAVGRWRERFARERLAGLDDRPRPGKPPTYRDADRLRVIETACNKTPEAETHWSVRTLARATGVGRETVHRLLQQADLKPHR